MDMSVAGFCLDCGDAEALAEFYSKLLGWEITIRGNGWAGIHAPQGFVLAFQPVEDYVPPVWPWKGGEQQQMAHMDFTVENLPEAVAHAVKCGAKIADEQFFDSFTVMLDPAGHPFCLSAAHE